MTIRLSPGPPARRTAKVLGPLDVERSKLGDVG